MPVILSEANRLKEETDAAIAAYEQALAEARNKAHGIAHDTRAKLKADHEARREKAEAELNEQAEGSRSAYCRDQDRSPVPDR